jgi:hypothetical protein
MLAIAKFVGCLIALQGLFGLLMPAAFVEFVKLFQVPPVIYIAAFVRIVIGLILLRASRQSRTPIAFRILGTAIVVGGMLTPFFGVQIADVILGWWDEGGALMVRCWAFGSLAIGAAILFGALPPRRAH